jgi:chromosome partitioning protein
VNYFTSSRVHTFKKIFVVFSHRLLYFASVHMFTPEQDNTMTTSLLNRLTLQIISVLSQKGGAGKTTLTAHLAVAAALDGLNTLVVDLDPQASAAKWSDRRQAEMPVVVSAHASRLAQTLENAKTNDGHLAILDTAPHSDSIALQAARAADLIIIPCRPSILDLEAIASTLDLVRTTAKPVLVVLNAIAPVGSEADEAAEAIASLGAEVCPIRLVNRVDFARSMITGHTAQETRPDSKAAQEIKSLHAFICERLNMFMQQEDVRHVQ